MSYGLSKGALLPGLLSGAGLYVNNIKKSLIIWSLGMKPNSATKKPFSNCSRLQLQVRGYWGDIINSPYFAMGVQVDDVKDRARLFRVGY